MSVKVNFTTADENYIVKEYKSGYSMAIIGEEFGVSVPTIRRILVSKNVTIRDRGRPAQS